VQQKRQDDGQKKSAYAELKLRDNRRLRLSASFKVAWLVIRIECKRYRII
jgi:hypothetical protein